MTLLGAIDSLAGAVVGIFTWTFGISVLLWLLNSTGIKLPEHRIDGTYLYPIVLPIAPQIVAKAVELLPASHRFIVEWKKEYLNG